MKAPHHQHGSGKSASSSKVTSGEDDDLSDWLEASDWDNPLHVAILYKDHRRVECGHAVQWNAQRLVDSKHCPVCQGSISFICDGGGRDVGPRTAEDPHVCFKFGKQTYSLSLKNEPSSSSYSTDWLSSFLNKWSIRSASTTTNSSSTSGVVLAQDRIQTALKLADGFKILHKGKVLYPSTPSTATAPPGSHKSPREVSDLLVELSASAQQQQQSSSSPSFLVVMGTLHGRELPARPVEKKAYSQQWTWQQLLQLPLAIVYWTIHSTWVFAKAFLSPFFSWASLAGDDDTNHHHHHREGSHPSHPEDDDNDHRHRD